MPASKKLLKFLEKKKVKYEAIEHRTVFTAYDKAATLKIPEKTVGKTLVFKLDNEFGIALIPANKNLDKGKLKKTANTWRKKAGQKPVKNINFATEGWMKKNLKGAKVGAVPPLGSLWKLPTFIDKSLMRAPKIVVNAGDYNWSIKISPPVLKKLIPDLIAGHFSKAR